MNGLSKDDRFDINLERLFSCPLLPRSRSKRSRSIFNNSALSLSSLIRSNFNFCFSRSKRDVSSLSRLRISFAKTLGDDRDDDGSFFDEPRNDDDDNRDDRKSFRLDDFVRYF